MSSEAKEIIYKSSEKKTYTQPILTKYGKLAEITAGGVGTGSENKPWDPPIPPGQEPKNRP